MHLIANVWIANSVHCLHSLISNNSLMKNFTAHLGLAKTQESIKYLVEILKQNLHRHRRRNHTLSSTFIQVLVALLPLLAALFCKLFTLYRWFLGVADTNDVIQKIEKTLNNTHTTTQKRTNNSFRNTKKHPLYLTL